MGTDQRFDMKELAPSSGNAVPGSFKKMWIRSIFSA
jgi:hypothetical protein